MTDLKVLAEGRGEYLKVDPDGYREWVRDHKDRAMVPKLMSEKDAVEKLVADGDYLVYECNYLQRGPAPATSSRRSERWQRDSSLHTQSSVTGRVAASAVSRRNSA